MTKYWKHGFAALVFAFAVVTSTSVVAEEDITAGMFAENDVFVDEGDGDFDTSAAAPAQAEAKPAPAPAPDTSAVEEELATPTIVEEKEAAPSTQPANEDLFADEDPKAAPVAQEEEKPAPVKKDKPAKKVAEKKVEKKAKAPKATKVAKSSSKSSKGHFAWTTGTCKLKRAPASTKGSLGETAASKKIWVVDVDSKWVKVWNKAGEEAFLSKSCLK